MGYIFGLFSQYPNNKNEIFIFTPQIENNVARLHFLNYPLPLILTPNYHPIIQPVPQHLHQTGNHLPPLFLMNTERITKSPSESPLISTMDPTPQKGQG